jgi:hypothetical protein
MPDDHLQVRELVEDAFQNQADGVHPGIDVPSPDGT